MANAAAKMFKAYLESKDMTCRYVDDEERVVRVGWKLDNTSIDIYFTFGEDNHDVHLQGLNFLQVTKENFGKALQIVNACNENYRWVKFILDVEHTQVVVEDDAVIDLDTCAEEIFELMIRMTQIVDEAYPQFMKAMWA